MIINLSMILQSGFSLLNRITSTERVIASSPHPTSVLLVLLPYQCIAREWKGGKWREAESKTEVRRLIRKR